MAIELAARLAVGSPDFSNAIGRIRFGWRGIRRISIDQWGDRGRIRRAHWRLPVWLVGWIRVHVLKKESAQQTRKSLMS